MRFWPFGKDKDGGDVEFVSRIVAGKAADGSLVRGKLTLHFTEPRTRERADELADRGATAMRQLIESARAGASLLGQERQLATSVQESVASEDLRSTDVVAVHVVGEPTPLEPMTRRPSSRPPPHAPRRASSSQMLSARDSRLIPEGSTPEAVGDAIVPLVRDAKTRVLVGVLRAYDLLVVRHVELDPRSSDDLGDIVPVSTAAPGRFEQERADELSRWSSKLGGDKLGELQAEAATVVCHFLHANLTGSGLDAKVALAILERAAANAFPDRAPLSELGRYLHTSSEDGAAGELAARTLAILGGDVAAAAGFAPVITPILQSLQDDFAFVAQQVLVSGVKRATP